MCKLNILCSYCPKVTSYGSESGRNFPEYQTSDTHYRNKREYKEYSAENGNENSEYHENNQDSNVNIKSKPLDWKRFGDTIERQIDIFNVFDIVVRKNKIIDVMADLLAMLFFMMFK